MKKTYLLIIFIIGLSNLVFSNKPVDFKFISLKYNADYFKEYSIPIEKNEAIYFTFSNNQEFVTNYLLIQGDSKFRTYKKVKKKKEFLLFKNAIAIKSEGESYLYILSGYKLEKEIIKLFNPENVFKIYGLGDGQLNISDYKISFNPQSLSKSIFSERLEHIANHSEHKYNKEVPGCGCNENTTSCSCTQGNNSCSVTCSGEAYACCQQGWNSPSCDCVQKDPEQ